jgi:hypothetical protein
MRHRMSNATARIAMAAKALHAPALYPADSMLCPDGKVKRPRCARKRGNYPPAAEATE